MFQDIKKGAPLNTVGSNLTDEVAEQDTLSLEMPIFHWTPHLPAPVAIPIFAPAEKELRKVGAEEDSEGRWLLLDGREMFIQTDKEGNFNPAPPE